jgi:EmrB/QacA subfamily drug resistance transporter
MTEASAGEQAALLDHTADALAAHAGRVKADAPGASPVAVLSVTTVGALLASVQGSALIIALPSILTSLRADFLTIMWVLLGYLLITTALVPVAGRLADMVGRKRLYLVGFGLFTLGSLLAGLSQPQFHGWDMVAARGVQGVGGAMLFTISAALVTDAFRHHRVGLGLGVNTVAAAAGFLVGPVVGGLLTAVSWRLVFLVNVPLGVAGTIWGIARLREPALPRSRQGFDWVGSLTFTVGLGALLLGLSLIAFPLIPTGFTRLLFPLAAVALTAFVVTELRVRYPMLDLRLFRIRRFALACLANGLSGLARGAVLFILIFFLQGPYGRDPLQAGIMMAPFGGGFMLVGPLSGYLSDRFGSRNLATGGLLISALALLGLSTIDHTVPYWELALLMALMGAGSGLFSSPNTRDLMTSVPVDRRGIAAGTGVMMLNTGQMLSIAFAFPLVLSRIPQAVMFHVFLYGGGMQAVPSALIAFEHGIHQAFLVSFGAILLAAVVSALRPGMPAHREALG